MLNHLIYYFHYNIISQICFNKLQTRDCEKLFSADAVVTGTIDKIEYIFNYFLILGKILYYIWGTVD